MIIPNPILSNFYGSVNSCLWFEVTNQYGIYVVNLEVTPNQNYDVEIAVQNLVDSQPPDYSLSILRTASQTPVVSNKQLLHDPAIKSPIYSVLNTIKK
jgi:hypothetical protein